MLIFTSKTTVSAAKHDMLFNVTCRIRSLHLFADSWIVVGTWESGERSAGKQLNYLLQADWLNTCLSVIVTQLCLDGGGRPPMGKLAQQWSTVVNKTEQKEK